MRVYKNCQSCGMPLAKDELGGERRKVEPQALNIAATAL